MPYSFWSWQRTPACDIQQLESTHSAKGDLKIFEVVAAACSLSRAYQDTYGYLTYHIVACHVMFHMPCPIPSWIVACHISSNFKSGRLTAWHSVQLSTSFHSHTIIAAHHVRTSCRTAHHVTLRLHVMLWYQLDPDINCLIMSIFMALYTHQNDKWTHVNITLCRIIDLEDLLMTHNIGEISWLFMTCPWHITAYWIRGRYFVSRRFWITNPHQQRPATESIHRCTDTWW